MERFELLPSAFLAGNLTLDLGLAFAEQVDQVQRLLTTVERLGLQRSSAALTEQLATCLARSVA